MAGLFGHPSGFAGRVVGHLMAVKNAALNQGVVEVLDPQPDDRILEVGFGPAEPLDASLFLVSTLRVFHFDPVQQPLGST